VVVTVDMAVLEATARLILAVAVVVEEFRQTAVQAVQVL